MKHTYSLIMTVLFLPHLALSSSDSDESYETDVTRTSRNSSQAPQSPGLSFRKTMMSPKKLKTSTGESEKRRAEKKVKGIIENLIASGAFATQKEAANYIFELTQAPSKKEFTGEPHYRLDPPAIADVNLFGGRWAENRG